MLPNAGEDTGSGRHGHTLIRGGAPRGLAARLGPCPTTVIEVEASSTNRRQIKCAAAACLLVTMPVLGQEQEHEHEQEVIALGDGSSITVDEYLLETSDEGATIIVKARPNFDPEPTNAVPRSIALSSLSLPQS